MNSSDLLFKNKTHIMGILNVTPDSFSDGGLYATEEKALTRVSEMLDEGAHSIDVGGESTRPGAESVSSEEELKRTIPIILAIRKKFGKAVILSIDTYKAEVAKKALEAGADFVNSIGGFQFDPELAQVIKEYNCPIVIYHVKGLPRTMQVGEIVYKDIIADIKKFFTEQIDFGISRGMDRSQFILDPGIGFGKTVEQNLEIIKHLKEFAEFNLPLLIGVSRKSHLGKILQEEFSTSDPVAVDERLEATLAETAVAVMNGVSIVRTHDVLQTRKFLAVLNKLL